MKVRKYEATNERQVLIGMIVSKKVLVRISPKWEKNLFKSKWSNLIAQWCVTHFRKYGRAPKKQIKAIFARWAGLHEGEVDAIKMIERFLGGLSKEYEQQEFQTNADFIADLAGDYFNEVKTQRIADEVQDFLAAGNKDKAQELLKGYRPIELGIGANINLLNDPDLIDKAFASKSEPVLEYGGALKNFYGDALERDGFIAFLGQEKRGKSTFLLDLAWRGVLQNRRVAYFECGDLSQDQLVRRFMIRACKRPWDKRIIKIPEILDRNGDDVEVKDYREVEYKDNLTPQLAKATFKKILGRLKNKKPLNLQTHYNSSLSMSMIDGSLDSLSKDSWIADIVVIDYADILAPAPGFSESRDSINANWKAMRAISQKYHCLVVTATQTNAAAYKQDSIDMSNFSEDKRKFSHVTGMIGINQSDTEKQMGIIRLNWLIRREAAFDISKHVHVAGCLDIWNPCIRSIF